MTSPSLNISLAEQTLPPGEHRVPPLAQHTLIYVLDALRIKQQRDGKTDQRILTPGTLIVAPAWLPSVCTWGETLRAVHIRLPHEQLQQVAEEMEIPNAEQLEIINNFGMADRAIAPLIELLSTEHRLPPGFRSALYTDTLTTALTIQVLRNYSQVSASPTQASPHLSRLWLKHAVEFIHSHLNGELRLRDIAAAACLSPFHFSREFKRMTGLSPHQYVITERLKLAQQLLHNTELPMAEIAAASGFYDASHLTRALRRVWGVSPGELQDSKHVR